MDLHFEPTSGRPFSMEVGYFDTIQEIKEKIQKYHNIPPQKQTLIFNNQTLPDDLNIHPTDIIDNSHIQLIITADPTTPEKPTTTIKVKQESSPPPATPPQPATTTTPSRKIQLLLKMPTMKLGIAMELGFNDSIRRLKERIVNEVDKGIPVGKIVVRSNGVELHDHSTLHECGLSDHSEIDISIKRSSPTTSMNATTNTTTNNNNNNNNNNNSKKLKIMVLTKCGKKKIPVEVNASDNVGELRKELQKVSQWGQLHLPQEGFFFIYKQNVMDEDRSFRWHHVGQGDTIEMFNGSISGGS